MSKEFTFNFAPWPIADNSPKLNVEKMKEEAMKQINSPEMIQQFAESMKSYRRLKNMSNEDGKQ